MTTETINGATDLVVADATAETGEGAMTLEKALEQIKAHEAKFTEAVSTRDKAKAKLRELEEQVKQVDEFKKKHDDLFAKHELTSKELNALKEGVKSQSINSTLQAALEASGAKAPGTALKLVDKSKLQFDEAGKVTEESMLAAIKEVQDSDPFLFGESVVEAGKIKMPDVRRAGESETQGAFDKELQSATTHKQIEAVLRKYGKL